MSLKHELGIIGLLLAVTVSAVHLMDNGNVTIASLAEKLLSLT